MKKMLWGGRFRVGPSAETIEFNSSENIRLDAELIPYDILGSMAHVRMLCKQRIISGSDCEQVTKALRTIYGQWKKGIFKLKTELEDVHMNVENAVSAITPAGKKMHTARSRNDQVLLDMRLYMRDKTLEIVSAIQTLQKAFATLSKNEGIMIAYTHTRVAQPITVSFWCQSWVESLGRDVERILDVYNRINQNPLGAGAVAGTGWNIDRNETSKLLAFKTIQENELDTISSRGECETELLFALAMVMCKLSRLSEELIWLSQKGLMAIAEEHTTGSSMMPNKKNPDVLELVRGRTGRVYGNLCHCLTTLKGLMAGYNSDMQETKFAVMGGANTTLTSLSIMAHVVAGISFDQNRIMEELDQGFAQATEIADYLSSQGMPFREAHEKSGSLVKVCEQSKKTIGSLDEEEASKLLGIRIAREKWIELRGFERKRLKRGEIMKKFQTTDYAEVEQKKIDQAYASLLNS